MLVSYRKVLVCDSLIEVFFEFFKINDWVSKCFCGSVWWWSFRRFGLEVEVEVRKEEEEKKRREEGGY